MIRHGLTLHRLAATMPRETDLLDQIVPDVANISIADRERRQLIGSTTAQYRAYAPSTAGFGEHDTGPKIRRKPKSP